MPDRFLELIESLHVGVVVQGPSTEVLVCNSAALDLLGLDADQYYGKTSYDPDWNIIREDGSTFDAADRPMARVLSSGKPIRNVVMGVYRPRRRDRVWLLVDALPELDERGRVVQVVATLSDITQRKALESSLLEARKLDSIGRLAGGIAHDFNNLLAVITGATSLAISQLAANSPLVEDLQLSLDAAARAATLTRQLLTFARRRDVTTKVAQVNAVIAAMEPLLTSVIGGHIKLNLRLDPISWHIQMDPVELEQVIVNLAANARDAMPAGGTLTIATRNRSVTASDSVPAEDYVELTVVDDGIGMDEATRGQIFEPFFTTKELGTGTGLGLATVHGVVTQHRGVITVASEPGRGTTFTLLLRRAELAASPSVPPPSQIAVGGRETILVVEDEAMLRSLADRILQKLGYRVLTAVNGVDALRVAAEHPGTIDLLFTDLTMPQMDGVRLSSELCARHTNLRVLITSGFATFDRLPRDRWHMLEKPYNANQLAIRIRAVLDA